MAGRRKTRPNAVREAVERLGGVVETCAILKVSNATLFRWMAAGSIPTLGPALKLSKASGIPAERFVGDESS